MLSKTKYLDVTVTAPSAPSMDENASLAETVIVQDTDVDHPLWTPPMFVTSAMKGVDNKKYFVDGSADQCWQMGYDLPKQQHCSAKAVDDLKLRYANIKSPQKRLSEPDMSELLAYDRPLSNKRVQSYLEMDKIDPHIQNNLNNELQLKDKVGNGQLPGVREISFTFVNQ